MVVLLLAVAGVSAAQESGIFLGGPNSDDSPESTTQESTSLEATVADDPETTTSVLPGPSSEAEEGEEATEPAVVTEPEAGGNEQSTVVAPVEEKTPAPGPNDVGKPGSSGRSFGKPEGAGKPPSIGEARPRDEAGPPGNDELEGRGNEAEDGHGGGRHKVTLCHKGKTLTVGAPALAAHERHGDSVGICPGGSESEPSGEARGPQAARNGEGGSGGQEKVTLCHKGKTITVGAPAWAAHERHGDDLGACP